jgi:hypothetical protein
MPATEQSTTDLTGQSASTPRPRSTGFSRLPNSLVDSGVLRRLTPASLRVLLVMLRLADGNGRCWPSINTLARRAGISKRSAHSAVQELRWERLVILERRGVTGRSSLYRLALEQALPVDA